MASVPLREVHDRIGSLREGIRLSLPASVVFSGISAHHQHRAAPVRVLQVALTESIARSSRPARPQVKAVGFRALSGALHIEWVRSIRVSSGGFTGH